MVLIEYARQQYEDNRRDLERSHQAEDWDKRQAQAHASMTVNMVLPLIAEIFNRWSSLLDVESKTQTLFDVLKQ